VLNTISRAKVVGTWIAAVFVIMVATLAAGATLTTSTGVLWLLTAVVPSGVLLLVWQGPPPVTVAELLHAVNTASKEDRR
jgi:hypothetical protein